MDSGCGHLCVQCPLNGHNDVVLRATNVSFISVRRTESMNFMEWPLASFRQNCYCKTDER